MKSDLLHTLSTRGFIHQGTDLETLDALCASQKITGYIGFDATADSLHVGSLVQIMLLRHLQQTGHTAIVLMGGGTTKVGDPSGKDTARQLLDDAAIQQNISGIQQIFANYIDFNKAQLVNNDDWLRELNYIAFLRDFGAHFSVNRMLSFDSVKLRLEREQPLSFLEFNYMILQAYDFLELNKRYGCVLQMGGSDQWGNIVNGVDLTRRVLGKTVFGLTSPLLTTSSGAKMGKTAQGAVWLSADKLSPYDFWQFWRNTEDADVARFLKLFTELSLEEIAKLEALGGAEINEAKKILATAVTTLCHGEKAAVEAEKTAKETFEQGLSSAGLPTTNIPKATLEKGLPLLDALVQADLTPSKSEARRFIKVGAIRINDCVIQQEQHLIRLEDFQQGETLKLSVGKKKHGLLKIA